MAELDQTAIRKITRDDIYRQRVFGTKSGKSDFIKVDDKRRLTRLGLGVYVVLIYLVMNFTWDRVMVSDGYHVNSAIYDALSTMTYATETTPQHWGDVTTTDDVKAWLLYAFPAAISPEVLGFIYPLGSVRFTLRRISTVENKDVRFSKLAPTVWKEKSGIRPLEKERVDNTEAYGNYRSWISNYPLSGSSFVGLVWCHAENAQCPPDSELLDELELDAAVPEGDTEQDVPACKLWCEGLVENGRPCRCWTQITTSYGTNKCQFYYTDSFHEQAVSSDALVVNDARMSTRSNHPTLPVMLCTRNEGVGYEALKNSVVLPQLTKLDPTEMQDLPITHFPLMLRWGYSESGGWRKTPGFISHLRIWSQADVQGYESEYSSVDPSETFVSEPSTSAHILFNQLRDWMDGGMLTRGAVALAVDFVTYNPHYKVYSWVQTTFTLEASGTIDKRIWLNSLTIDPDEATQLWDDNLGALGFLYIALVACYVLVEIWELGQKCGKYFLSAWNWLNMTTLMLQILTLLTRHRYLQEDGFKALLVTFDGGSTDVLEEVFEAKAFAYQTFVWVSGLNLLFVWFQMLHYLHDNFDRVRVLVDTMTRALTPIIFLMIVIADSFFGFVLWSNLMYGKSVKAFSTFGDALTACTELCFGQVDSYSELKVQYPVSGSLFVIVYMMVFYFVIQNLSKAVVLVSYADAIEGYDKGMHQEEQTRLARQSEGGKDWFKWKALAHKITRGFMGGRATGKKSGKVSFELASYTYSTREFLLFALFVICYVVMTYLMVQVSWSHQMAESIVTALKTPTFSKMNRVSGQWSHDNSFDTIQTREDVTQWLTQVLPQAMFNSSVGTFDGKENPLKLYPAALPEANYTQLVINNWNILVGQTPVRITTNYFAELEPTKVLGQLIPRQARAEVSLNGVVFTGPHEFTLRPSNNQTQSVLDKYCRERFGFSSLFITETDKMSCMLGVDYHNVTQTLQDFAANDFINDQTAVLFVDFVVYNGFAEAFLYVAISFEFQPSGRIDQRVTTSIVRLEPYRGVMLFRVIFEILVLLLALYFLLQLLAGTYRKIKEDLAAEKQAHMSGGVAWRLMVALRAIFRYLILDPFHFLDFCSGVMTLVMMTMWYENVFGPLTRDYIFPEEPVWPSSRGACKQEWCADDEVLHKFFWAGLKLDVFTQTCALNTVLVLFRMLKYLQAFPSMRLMFNTFRRGAKDLAWFILAMSVVLMGYVCVGHQLFGARVEGFKNMYMAVITCFEMFLGTYSYSDLRDTEPVAYIFFSYTYMVILKYVLINMFFAIVDKHYHTELNSVAYRREMEVAAKDSLGTQLLSSLRSLASGQGLSAARSNGRRRRSDNRTNSSLTGSEKGAEDEAQSPSGLTIDALASPLHSPSKPGAESTFSPSPTALTPRATPTTTKDSSLLGQEATLGMLALPYGQSDTTPRDGGERPPIAAPKRGRNKNCYNWHVLPQDIQKWALENACAINREFIEGHAAKRQHGETEAAELDRILQEAEEELKAKRKDERKQAEAALDGLKSQQLMRLKEIHQDQESLAWYIMKREAELKNLEQMRQMKQDRFHKMVQAATSLISSDEQAALSLEDSKQ
mmetsp:Transcript_39229/g.101494  ORF Transcript_39229/g.101494 Transcript_39229/m.101494 type:complete len:1589 (+) Transcript_39229:109-4875(+)